MRINKKLVRAIKSTQLNVLGWLIQFIHLLFLFTPSLHSQDIEDTSTDLKNRLKNNPITFTGSIAAQIQWNTISGMDQRRDPFHLNLFGHANLNILGVNAPFSLAMADGNTTYNLPSYTFVGISPTYRWAKLHLFRRNMNFSKYTLAGHGFNGVGIELRPGNWRIASMYGTLRKAQIQDFGYRHQLDPHFKRLGYGIKFGYESREDYLHLTLFKAEDDPTSLTFGDTTGIAAKDNIVLSTQVKKKISKVLGIEGEYAYSIYTPEKSFLPRAYDGIDHLVHSLVTINGSTRSSSAYHFDIYFRPDQLGDFALGYERIAPDFVSLGTMQFQNDFEHFTASYRGKMKRTIGVSARIGIERNNLDGTELESRNRFIGSLQINIPIDQRWRSSVSYSNFNQTTRLVDNSDPFQPVDSIFLGSTNHQLSLQSNFRLDKENQLIGFITHQRANTIHEEQITHNTAAVTNAGLSYSFSPKDGKIRWTSSIFFNSLRQEVVTSSSWSPSFRLHLTLSTHWNASFTVTDHLVTLNKMSNGNVIRLGITSQYTLSEKQGIQLRLQWINRSGSAQEFSETHGNFTYNYRF